MQELFSNMRNHMYICLNSRHAG